MRDVSSENFGLLVAYLIPGFIALSGAGLLVPAVAHWFETDQGSAPTVGGFLYGTLGSVGTGMLVSAVRWALIDTLHHRTGIAQPPWDFQKLPANLAAVESHVRDHFRYYQFYSHTLLALLFTYGCFLVRHDRWPGQSGWMELLLLPAIVVLFSASRDSLRKYYARTEVILHREISTARRSRRDANRRKPRERR